MDKKNLRTNATIYTTPNELSLDSDEGDRIVKRLTRILNCIIVFLLAIVLVACSTSNSPNSTTENNNKVSLTSATPTHAVLPTSTPFVEKDNIVGREKGNHFLTMQGNTLFYCFDSLSISKVQNDGGKRTKIIQKSCDSLNVVGDWIYFKNTTGMSGEICKIRTDGTGYTVLVENGFNGGVIATSDYIFYAGSGPNLTMCVWRMDTDGTNKVLISSEPSDFITDLSYEDGWVIYTAIKSNVRTNIIKVRTTGKDKTVVKSYNHNIWKTVVTNGRVYYICGDRIYKTSLDNSETIELITDNQMISMLDIIFADDYIYYMRNTDDSMSLYRVKVDGSGQEEIEPNVKYFYGINAGWIFYGGSDGPYCIMKLDGSEKQKFNMK